MIALGTMDQDVQPAALDKYLDDLKKLTVESWGQKLRGEADNEWVAFQPQAAGPMKVRDLQGFLQGAGFFPFGNLDGICGYRTNSAIRLFQEYVRTVEGIAEIGTPDGKFGNKSAAQVQRWQAADQRADWTAFSAAQPSPEFNEWMTLLKNYQAQAVAAPSAILQKVNAFAGKTDTVVKPEHWDFDPNKIHLVGIRRTQAGGAAPAEQRFDDVFVLLIQGVVFKFFGSTDPGAKTAGASGYPFLTPGQHLFRFGWHKLSDTTRVYHALKPFSTSTKTASGVLVVRSADLLLTEKDFAGKLEANATINIHWGGEGGPRVSDWSHGCQVFAGKSYLNHHDQTISCEAFAAGNYRFIGKRQDGYKTKGAYSVLEDLVTAFSGTDNVVRYTLLHEQDLALHPALGAGKAQEVLQRLQAA